MTQAFVGVGSNIDPATNVRRALCLLARETDMVSISTVYETMPLGRPSQPHYYNCVVEIATETPPLELKQSILRRIEAELGRQRSADEYAARVIDLDLILYDELVLKSDELTLPDPDIARRPFLAMPLFELAPELVLPGSGVRLESLARELGRDQMTALRDYTDKLRKDILDGAESCQG